MGSPLVISAASGQWILSVFFSPENSYTEPHAQNATFYKNERQKNPTHTLLGCHVLCYASGESWPYLRLIMQSCGEDSPPLTVPEAVRDWLWGKGELNSESQKHRAGFDLDSMAWNNWPLKSSCVKWYLWQGTEKGDKHAAFNMWT